MQSFQYIYCEGPVGFYVPLL